MSSRAVDFAAILAGYLVGALPTTYLLGRAWGVDLRKVGSKNVGAGNLTRFAGVKAGVLAALIDGLKGLIPTYVARKMGLGVGPAALVGIAAVAGHSWTVFLRGRAGRGLATSAGVLAAINPMLLIWPAAWAMIGWKVGGGIGGFIGWGLLPIVPIVIGAASLVPVTMGLSVVMLARRAQGNPDRVPGFNAAMWRMIHDNDSHVLGDEAAEEVARA